MHAQKDLEKKDLQTVIIIIFFLTLALFGLKIYENKSGFLERVGSEIFDRFITK